MSSDDDRYDDKEGDVGTIAKSSVAYGTLIVGADEQAGTMLVLGPPNVARVEISGYADVVPAACSSLGLSLAAVPVKPGTDVSVRAFAADGQDLFELSARVVANRSSLIGTVGSPPTT